MRRELTLFFIDVPRLRPFYANVRPQSLGLLRYIKTCVLTICRLIKEAAIESKQGGERGITARSVKKVTGV